ncbi:uncharacterized protein LOC117384830 [Periophthalmus magnuspinnatus]|uniref:uncharacterized protein LOC117384830 n=1 Tax=Periophthalmus magnuspinnatus TaxID=409849 RepID=UPI00145C0334|nr:uncharacterized protein LOC117384830 [Periophthalmus magnuspinnatus]
MKIGSLPMKEYTVLVTPVKEWIIGMDILAGMTLHLQQGKFVFGTTSTIQARPVLVGKVKMTPFPIPIASKVVNMKQYRIPGGHDEITSTIKDYVKAGVLKTCTTEWNNPIWPVRKSDGTWRMTVDYRQLNKFTPPLTSAVPDSITIIQKVQHHPGTWYGVIDLANAFFTIPIPENRQEQFAFTWDGRQYTFTRLPQGYLHSPTICHRVVAEHLDMLTLPPGVMISHYIDDIMIQGPNTERLSWLKKPYNRPSPWQNLWQKQGRARRPLGFWSRKLPDAGGRYTPFEKQLLACYWALLETEAQTVGHDVLMRPEIPIMSWVMSDPATHRIGTAQESSIIKWKWYISERAKSGPKGVSVLHEQVADTPEHGEVVAEIVKIQDSPVKQGKRYDELTDHEKQHAWFTDGSAKWTGGKRKWKAGAFNPALGQVLEAVGDGKSSQWAELKAVHMVIMREGIEQAHIYTDSWSVMNGLTTWMPTWHSHDWTIHGKQIWGTELWKEIWERVQTLQVFVMHVDAHTHNNDAETLHNNHIDQVVQVIDLGLGLQCPKGTYGHIVPKASMALKGMTVDAGVLDPDFKGTLVVICKNNTDEPLVIKQGQAIAQLLIRPYVTGAVQEVQMPSTLVEGETPKIDKAGAKVWVKQPDGPPKAGEVIAQGEDSTVAVMYPGEEKWVNVPISKCYLREN